MSTRIVLNVSATVIIGALAIMLWAAFAEQPASAFAAAVFGVTAVPVFLAAYRRNARRQR